MVGKRAGRVGDSPILGAGTYADDESGAASATGEGEAVLRLELTRHVCELLRAGASPEEAARAGIDRLGARLGASGGLIVVDAKGRVGHARNTQTMSWGLARAGEAPTAGH
jgi:beta-aspartyl-peptidase (threonine type)